jgi:DNA-binding NarL/FixJ family response regulator
MKPVRVLIVDDHMLFRQGVRSAIEGQEDIEVVGEAGDGKDALSKARKLKPDLILMDIGLPHGSGLEALSAIKDALPGTKIVMLTVHDDDENLFSAVKRGAEGFLCKNVRAQDLVGAVRGVMRGEAALSKRMAARILKEFARLAKMEVGSTVSQLTPREKEVLQKLSEGLSNKEIAHALYISENTVKAHVTNILRKLHLQNRSQAAVYVQRWGLSGIS